MHILFAAAEAIPYAKRGGLADVVGSLPYALRRLDVDARIMMPLYGFIDRDRYNITHEMTFQLPRPTGTADVEIWKLVADEMPIYFIKSWPFFGDEFDVYTEWKWDVPRFIFFNQAVMAACEQLKQAEAWFPDVIHVNDWHTGLIPFFLDESRHDAAWSRVASVLSIHNIAHQGEHVGGWLWELGIPGRHHPDLVYQGLTDNMLAIAIAYSDMVSTVSPRYAIEIQYPYMGYGLDGLIKTRSDDLYGILNGLDVDRFNPETDPVIESRFNAENFREKRPPNKHKLQESVGLPVRDETFVIGIVTRIEWQKGLDLVRDGIRPFLTEADTQFILLGSGDPDLSADMAKLVSDFEFKSRAIFGYDAVLAQRIYAGCDIFLMPSHFEPCGIGQMIAMRYGALPLVRETGGLADTVVNYDNGPADVGTGFVFSWEEPQALLNTVRWAYQTFRNRQDAWQRMQQRAMQMDFSWDKSARAYITLYEKAIKKRRETA